MSAVRRVIAIHNAHPRLRFAKREVESAIAVLDAHAEKFLGGCPAGELSVAFLTDPALTQIHANFMDDPTATDVITFEGDSSMAQAGEICVSADTAARFVGLPPAEKWGKSPRKTNAATAKFSAELTLYVVHGWLHLAGYDDLQPAKKRRMRAAEKRAMILLSAAGSLPAFRLV